LPKSPVTIGEHLKARRFDLKLHQRQVAAKLRVDTSTVLNWEKGKGKPAVSAWPAILGFLGYDPRLPPTTLPERLKATRKGLGWSIKKAARALHVDPSTVGDWERGRTVLFLEHRRRLAAFLGITEAEISSEMALAWGSAHRRNRR
jgi:transcriptional regulator with XRE-family HTH domain